MFAPSEIYASSFHSQPSSFLETNGSVYYYESDEDYSTNDPRNPIGSNADIEAELLAENSFSPATFTNAFYGLIFVLGVLGNLFVVFLILCCIRIKVVTNVYILNLAIADLFFLIWIPFVIARTTIGQWIWGLAACKLYFIGTTVNQFGSVAFLTALSVDRYFAICHPVKSRPFRTVRWSVLVVCFCWLVVSCMMTPVFMYATTVLIVHAPSPDQLRPINNVNFNINSSMTSSTFSSAFPGSGHGNSGGVQEVDDHEVQCMIHWPTDQNSFWNRNTFTLYSAVLSYFVPIMVIWSLYGMVLIRLRKRREAEKRIKLKSRKHSYRKVTTMVLSVVVSYSFCWLPFWIVQFMIDSLDEATLLNYNTIFKYASLAAYCLQYTNSVLNPVLYTFVSGSFKQLFWNFVGNNKGQTQSPAPARAQRHIALGIQSSEPSLLSASARRYLEQDAFSESVSRGASLPLNASTTMCEETSDAYL